MMAFVFGRAAVRSVAQRPAALRAASAAVRTSTFKVQRRYLSDAHAPVDHHKQPPGPPSNSRLPWELFVALAGIPLFIYLTSPPTEERKITPNSTPVSHRHHEEKKEEKEAEPEPEPEVEEPSEEAKTTATPSTTATPPTPTTTTNAEAPAAPETRPPPPPRETRVPLPQFSSKLNINDVDLKDKNVIIRTDYDLPIYLKNVVDDEKIIASLPTIRKAIDSKANHIIIVGHQGGTQIEGLSFEPVAKRLEELLKLPVHFIPDLEADKIEAKVKELPSGSIILLENVNFDWSETPHVASLSQSLPHLGNVFINDAFNASRRDPSVVDVNIPVRATGYLFQAEVNALSKVLDKPARPFVAIIGDPLLETRLDQIETLIDHKADVIFIAGGLGLRFKQVVDETNLGDTFLIQDPEDAKQINEIMNKAKQNNVKIILPSDYTIADKFSSDAEVGSATDLEGIPHGWLVLDLGPESSKNLGDAVRSAKTILWAGEVGVYQFPKFQTGSKTLATDIATATQNGAYSYVLGLDTARVARKFGVYDQLSYVSRYHIIPNDVLGGKPFHSFNHLSDK